MQTNKDIDQGREFDWGRASKDYAKFRDIYLDEFYEKILSLGLCTKGQHVLDLGTGTGVLPRNMVKFGATFVGADISENQINEALKLTTSHDVSYVVASAEDIDLPDNTFDVVTACQCFMYFDKNTALPKINKLLKDGRHFAILFMAWLPDESLVDKTSEDLVLKYNPHWTGACLKRYPPSPPKEIEGLFEVADAIGFDHSVTFTRESWHGRIVACRGIGASSLSAREIAAFEREHQLFLETQPEVFSIPHHATILNMRKT